MALFSAIPLDVLLSLTAALVFAGAVTGFLAGLFGVGGGTVVVPVLYQVFTFLDVPEDVRMHLAVGTSLAIIIPTSIQSFRTHHAKGAVLVDLLKVWAVPIVLGVMGGSVVAAFAPALVLKLVFIVVAGVIAVKLLMGREEWRISEHLPPLWFMWIYGLVIGLAASLMGIGGGVLSTLLLTLHAQPLHRAVATSAGIGVLVSLPGALGYVFAGWGQMDALPPFSLGYVSLLGFILIAPLSAWVAPYGARLAHRLPKRKLEVAFGIYLALVCARFVAGLV